MAKKRYGGSFAPPLTDEKLARYEELAASAPPQIQEPMRVLLKAVKHWWELPVSNGAPKMHASGLAKMVALDDEHIKTLDDDIPWDDELEVYQKRFNELQLDAVEKNDKMRAAFRSNLARSKFEAAAGMSYDSASRNAKAYAAVCNAAKPFGKLAEKIAESAAAAIFGDAKPEEVRASLQSANLEAVKAQLPQEDLEDTELRDACFHLLWFVKELALDREPITNDQL